MERKLQWFFSSIEELLFLWRWVASGSGFCGVLLIVEPTPHFVKFIARLKL
ncbi:MAG: hypothetical protein SPI78_07210 [Bergeyella zoohelcum]|nr:hypothetical protein [Bergeyella zoohelcum]